MKVPGYAVLEKISEGYGSLLLRGTPEKDHKPFLIRTYGAEEVSQAKIAQLKKKFSAIRDLNCNGILKGYEIRFFQDHLAIISEDFDGVDLKEYHEEEDNGMERFLNTAIQLSEVLTELHRENIIHRDLKTKNILAHRETGTVKIIDYGLSPFITGEHEALYDPQVLKDTLPYFSPEQTGRMNRTMDRRTDFYSLGIILYEILTGSPPFQSENPLEIFYSHIAKAPHPPKDTEPGIPKVISDIVMKLLSKDPEDRYQSGYGINADLRECLKRLKISGKINTFSLGKNEVPQELIIPERIYGRDDERERLLSIFDRVRCGKGEMILVSGPGGIGKTALVNEIQKPVTEHKGYFLSGKFDGPGMSRPYKAVIQAFQGLLRQILSERDEQIQLWRDRVREALGKNGRIITDIIPELELLIGEQEEVRELDSQGSQQRFHLVFQNFIRVFAQAEHPLAIFLDDLHWVDSGSLVLMEKLMTDPETEYILFVGAFREKEVPDSHPLRLWLNETRNFDIPIHYISLRPLNRNSVNRFIADTVRLSLHAVKSFSREVCEKTGGNPFFIKQSLKTLYDNGILMISPDENWQWDMEGIERMEMGEGLVRMLRDYIVKLSHGAQDVLTRASIIGNQFDLETLAEVCDTSIDDTYEQILESVDRGLILPTSRGFRFVHDRVLEAAYSLLDEQKRKKLHFDLGDFLLSIAEGEEDSENLFAIANHLNMGAEFATDREQQIRLARLNLTAGLRAKASVAFEIACEFLRQGLDHLPSNAWQSDYDLALTLYTESTEIEYLTGDHMSAEKHFGTVMKKAESALDKIRVYEVKIGNYTVLNRRKEALEVGRDALSILDFNMPERATPEAIHEAITTMRLNMREREVEDLISLSRLTDPHQMAVSRLLKACTAPSYTEYPDYVPIIVLKLLNISLKYGNSPLSAYTYATYGVILCGALGDFDLGYRFGRLALKVLEKFNAGKLEAAVCFAVGDMINHWKKHMREDLGYLLKAYTTGAETGDLPFASYALNHYMITSFFVGEPLHDVKEKLAAYHNEIKRFRQLSVIQEYEMWYQMVINLSGENAGSLHIKGEICDEDELVPEWIHDNHLTALGYYTVAKQILLYLNGAFEDAIHVAEKGTAYLNSIRGMLFVPEYYFYYSLALLARCPHVGEALKAEYLEQVKENQSKMKTWASSAPENFSHMYFLVEAETARFQEKIEEAMDLYDRAIDSARDNGFTQDEAIANELAGKFYLLRGREKIAAMYLQEASGCYKRWGMKAKVISLENENFLLLSQHRRYAPLTPAIGNHIHSPLKTPPPILDYISIVESLRAISSEIILEQLLERIMKVAMENAGAGRGLFISMKDGTPYAEMERTIEHNGTPTVRSISIEERDDVLIPAIEYVKRAMDHIVLDDASMKGDYVSDPYVMKYQPKSILCVPVIRQARLVGILYLENNMTTGAFTPDRLEVLQLLASQAAISLENAMLINDMKKAEEALQESREEYRNLIEQANDGIFIGQDRLTKYANKRIVEMIGYTVHEILDTPFTNYIHPDEHTKILDRYTRRMAGEDVIPTYETILQHKDGREVPVEITAGMTMYNRKRADLVILRDITDRKLTEAALKESEEKFRLISEQSSLSIMILQGGSVRYVNEKAGEIFGYSVEEMMHWKPNEFAKTIHPDHLDFIMEQKEKKQAGMKDVITEYSYRIIKKDGEVRWVRNYSKTILYQGRFADLITLADITDQKRAEDALRKSEEEYRNLIEWANDGIIILQDMWVRYANKRIHEMTGYEVYETIGTSFIDYIHPDDLPLATDLHSRRMSGEEVTPINEVSLMHKDGTKIYCEINSGPTTFEGKPADLIIIRDITERKHAAEKMERLNTELMDKNKELERLIYVASHDLRSPLVNIQGFSKELHLSIDEISSIVQNEDIPAKTRDSLLSIIREQIPESIRFINRSVSRIDSLLFGLLHISRIGRTDLDIRVLDMNRVVSQVISSFTFQIKEADVLIEADELPSCKGDEVQINQVFSNLLDNALKYRNPATPGIIRISGKKENDHVVYCVEDNGIGISSDHQENIFEMFHRLDPDAGPGEGLGLNIIQKILSRHCGKIWLDSEPGKGTKFYVSLPAV